MAKYIKVIDAVDKFLDTNSREFDTDQIVYLLNRIDGIEIVQHEILDEKQKEKIAKALTDRPKGKWLADNNFDYETRFKCSVCGESECVPTTGFAECVPIWDFCPNCGADMRGGTK